MNQDKFSKPLGLLLVLIGLLLFKFGAAFRIDSWEFCVISAAALLAFMSETIYSIIKEFRRWGRSAWKKSKSLSKNIFFLLALPFLYFAAVLAVDKIFH